jgi:hypothetical protein
MNFCYLILSICFAFTARAGDQAASKIKTTGVELQKISFAGFAIEYDRFEKMYGKAYWKESGKLGYLEEHTFYYNDNRRVKVETVYRWPTGEKFADFISDYTKHPYIPAYRFRDKRFDRIEGLEWLENGKIRIYGKKYGDRQLLSKVMDPPSPGFAAQGLNFFIVDNFEDLTAQDKDPVEVEFVAPMAQRSYGFRIKAKGLPVGNIVKFRAEIDNWFIRLFAPSIDVKYDMQKKVLLEYKGPSNLLNNEKDIETVVIKYDTSELSIQQANRTKDIKQREASVAGGDTEVEDP